MAYGTNTTHATIVQAIEQALEDCAMGEGDGINICRGEGKGCYRPKPGCKDCCRVDVGDLRTPQQIAAAMERGDA